MYDDVTLDDVTKGEGVPEERSQGSFFLNRKHKKAHLIPKELNHHLIKKRTMTSGAVSINCWKVCLRREHEEGSEEGSGRWLSRRTSGYFTTRTEGRCTVQQKAVVQRPLVCSWGC